MREKIIKIIKENVEELASEELSFDMPLITSGYLDSFDIIQLIDILEKEFEISLPLDGVELSDFETVNAIANLLQKKEAPQG